MDAALSATSLTRPRPRHVRAAVLVVLVMLAGMTAAGRASAAQVRVDFSGTAQIDSDEDGALAAAGIKSGITKIHGQFVYDTESPGAAQPEYGLAQYGSQTFTVTIGPNFTWATEHYQNGIIVENNRDLGDGPYDGLNPSEGGTATVGGVPVAMDASVWWQDDTAQSLKSVALPSAAELREFNVTGSFFDVQGFYDYQGNAAWRISASPIAWTVTSVPDAADNDLALASTPADITTNANSPAGAVVRYTPPTVVDEDIPQTATGSCLPDTGSTFRVGVTTVTCTATDDDDANSPVIESFKIKVKGAAGQLADLHAAVQGVGPGTSLADKVAAVQSALASGHTTDACGGLVGFVNEVKAQSGKKIPSTQASGLIADGKRIQGVLGCSK